MNKKTITFAFLGFALGALAFIALGGIQAKGIGAERCETCSLEIGSQEWQERMEERKERMEERRLNRGNNFMGEGIGPKMMNEEINHQFEIIDKGIRVTITSDNPDIVQRLQERAK